VRRVRRNAYKSLVPGGLPKDIIGLWSSRARSPENDRRVDCVRKDHEIVEPSQDMPVGVSCGSVVPGPLHILVDSKGERRGLAATHESWTVGVTHRFNELISTRPEVRYVCDRRNPTVLISLCSTV